MEKFPNPYTKGKQTWKTLQRSGDVVLLEIDNGWEVCVLIPGPAFVIAGKEIPARERMPSSEMWGSKGWTFSGTGSVSKEEAFSQAQEKFLEIVEREEMKKVEKGVDRGENCAK